MYSGTISRLPYLDLPISGKKFQLAEATSAFGGRKKPNVELGHVCDSIWKGTHILDMTDFICFESMTLPSLS